MTGDPGTDAEVTNTGTSSGAIFDFVIPRGEPGSGRAPEVLSTVDTSNQPSTAGGALTFNDTPLVSGTAITHLAGSTDVQINQTGIYQAAFHATIAVDTGTTIPDSVLVRLFLNSTPVPGATARHTFTSSNEVATISFDVPFQVSSTPATVQVVVDEAGFIFEESALTVIRLGDTTP